MKTDFGFVTRTDEMQRIGSCMLGAVAPASLAHEAVLSMEMGLLRQRWPVGQSLGALPDVRKQLGLGRPAFREAITILEARGLLDVRRGPGGGLFVAAPSLEDVAGAVLMSLALAGQSYACIEEFQLIVWRMIVNTAIQRDISLSPRDKSSSEWDFAVDFAEQAGNRTMALLARLSELLVQISIGEGVRGREPALESAIKQGDPVAILECMDKLPPVDRAASIVTLEIAERALSLSGRKSAMALAARLAHELSERGGAHEAEWETAERLGYTDAVVRQARRILQDFGIVRCRQGRKGAELALQAAPTGVIRQLAPCLVASSTSVLDNQDAIAFLASSAPVLAARRVKFGDGASMKPLASLSSPDALEALTLENLLLELSGNPLLAIVVRSLGLATIVIAGYPSIPSQSGDTIPINRRLLQAIEAGDEQTARTLARVKLAIMQGPVNSLRKVA